MPTASLRAAFALLLAAASIPAQTDWSWRNPLPQGNTLLGVTWTGSQCVAVGFRGAVITSPNGLGTGIGNAWTARKSGTMETLNDVVWTGTRLVAVGNYGLVMTSADAAAWSQKRIAASVHLNAAAAGGGKMVAVGWGDSTYFSADGVDWTAHALGRRRQLNGVAWTGSAFVAVGDSGHILTSADGRTWDPVPSGVTHKLRAVAWSGSLLVAVGDTVLTSPTGSAWTGQSLDRRRWLEGVTWGGTHFVAVGLGDSAYVSTDGKAWTPAWLKGADRLLGVVFTGDRYVAVGETGDIRTGSVPTNWFPQVPGWSSRTIGCVAWNGSKYLALGDSGYAWSSANGQAWTRSPLTFPAPNDPLSFRKLIWTGSRFAALFHSFVRNNSSIVTTQDGTAWDGKVIGNLTMRGLADAAGTLIAVGDSGRIITLREGDTAKPQVSGTKARLNAVAWAGERLVAVGDEGVILTSPDGVAWTSRFSGITSELIEVAWLEGRILALDTAGLVLASADGGTWSRHDTLDAPAWHLSAAGGRFYALKTQDTLISSADGRTWNRHFIPQVGVTRAFAVGSESLVATGMYGMIMHSPLAATGLPGNFRKARTRAPAWAGRGPFRIRSVLGRRLAGED